MAELMFKLKTLYDSLNQTEKRIADCLMQKPDDVIGLPIADFTEVSRSNKAAVIRFCRKMGCKGYRDFVIKLASEQAVTKSGNNSSSNEADEYIDVKIGDDIGLIIKNVSANNVKSINDSCLIIKQEDVVRARDLLIKARKIDFYGIGASGLVAMDAQSKFMRINKNCTAYQDPSLQLVSATNLTARDVAVAISWSGETKDVIEAARLAREAGAKVITVTSIGKNHLSEYGDIRFYLGSAEVILRCGALSSRIAQLNLIDIIYYSIVSHNYQNVKKYLVNTRQSVKGRRMASTSTQT